MCLFGKAPAMQKHLLLAVATAATAMICTLPSLSCGAFPREGPLSARPASIKLDKQSAFLWRQGKQEHMLLSVKYSGGTDEFAWVIPVEGKPKVTVEKGAPFTELRRLTEVIELMEGEGAVMRSKGAPGGGPPPVTVLERKEEGPYDLAVLSATSGKALYDWLKENKFAVSKDARGHLSYYIDRKYYWVAARIRNQAQGNEAVANRLKSGTIAPMHLTFPARQLSYPLKMTAVNPGLSEMEVFVAGTTWPDSKVLEHINAAARRTGPGMRVTTFKLTPNGGDGFQVQGPPGLAHPQGSYPTLRRLLPAGGVLNKYHGALGDAQRQEDLVFARL